MEVFSVVVSLAISLIILVGLLFLWKDFWIDELRDDLFGVRDRLFHYAVQHALVRHPAHDLLRRQVNSLIRYSHEISLPRLILLQLAFARWKPAPPDAWVRYSEAIRSLEPAQRECLEQFHSEMALLVARQVYKTSIFLRVVGFVAVLWQSVARGDGSQARQEMINKVPTGALEQDALSCAA